MINAGAILVCAILITLAKQELSLAEKFDFVMDSFQVDNVLFLTEPIDRLVAAFCRWRSSQFQQCSFYV